MKFYKIMNTDLVGLVGTFDFIGYGDDASAYAQSDTDLPSPFVEVQEANLPSSIAESIAKELDSHKTKLMEMALVAVDGLKQFESSVLGEPYIYDFSLEDQINLAQAREFSKVGGDTDTVGIRATKVSTGIKDNYLHTYDKIQRLFNEWYARKEKVLNAFSTMKIEFASATTKADVDLAFTKFETAIK